MNSLMEKLAISKAIMDKHNNISRGKASESLPIPSVQQFDAPQANYNIPQNMVLESQTIKNSETPTNDRIMNSKLPDSIKKLMIENPIEKPQSSGSVLSDELVEKASKLMGTQKTPQIQTESKNNSSDLRQMMKEVVKEVLMENGLLLESNNKANETVLIKVGQHIFEGKISRIKKVK